MFSLSGTTGEHSTLERMLLANRSPHLEDITIEKLEEMHRLRMPHSNKPFLVAISRVLAAEDLITRPLAQAKKSTYPHEGRQLSGCPEEWVRWCKKWFDTATITETTRRHYYGNLLRAGRWMAYTHPGVESPEQWTREMAAEYVAAVTRLQIGDWLRGDEPWPRSRDLGRPASAATKQHMIAAVRTCFRDLQEWDMMPRRFDPRVALATPRSVLAQIKRDPRVIADDMWAKLLWAGLNLCEEDLPRRGAGNAKPWYPLEMVRAAAVVWLFAGLRGDEIRRLPVGCVRWQRESAISLNGNGTSGKEAICWLDVPVNKTGDAFTKPVDGIVGKAVEAWEAMRPEQPAVIDRKTAEAVHYLFSYGGRQFGVEYLNHRLVPLLCRKAGVPEEDARGRITSHRARSTITTHLYNADEPMSLFELQEWLGHRSPEATQYYAKITPTRLAKSYSDAGYFRRNVRTIEVLLDGEAIRNGEAANGEPWKFYDLGHGYCSYDFYSHCPHRMACARCSFYVPKSSTKAQILEGKANLSRMREELPLSDEEIAAVEEGLELHEKLLESLADKPTPAGPTPRQLLQLDPHSRRKTKP